MTPRTIRELIAGPAGRIECAVDWPATPPLGLAVVCHPHPQGGGTLDNKVAQTIARACIDIGWASVRFNFRGVGASEGAWDEGRGEVDDALAVVAEWRCRDDFAGKPFVLGGFSFGGWVATEVAHRLAADAKPRRIVLVGASTVKQPTREVPQDTVVVHGEDDELVPLAGTLAWARPQNLPVIVFPGVGHFFHGQIALLKKILVRELRDLAAV
ncbi:MAG: alpha/beta hydrolase [Caldimonas sp.]